MILPCACGGTVTANRTRPGAGVRAHQRTAGHLFWAEEFFGKPRIVGPLTVDRLRELGYAPRVEASDTPSHDPARLPLASVEPSRITSARQARE